MFRFKFKFRTKGPARISGHVKERMPKDRRVFNRFSFITKAKYRFLHDSFNEIFTQNLSSSGMCLLLDCHTAPGMFLELEFKKPGADIRLKRYAKIVWQNDYLTGVKFVSLKKKRQYRIPHPLSPIYKK
ncbi:MAG: PilZ domain-containing protein [Candidatus Aminicenantes bacterium]|nr:PilZ domain-containing protein [Candidatus Aminicenantes bacterium]